MKRNLLFLFLALFYSFLVRAQYAFPTVAGPVNVAEASPVALNLNDVVNSAAVTNNAYLTLRLMTDWAESSGSPLPEEASVEVTTTAGTVVVVSPVTTKIEFCCPIRLTFHIVLPATYIPLSDGFLDVVLKQTNTGTSASWSNIDVNLLTCTMPIVSTAVVEDCSNDQYFVDVSVSDLGSLPPCSLSDPEGGFLSVSSTGVYRMGPFFSQMPTQIEVTGDSAHGCSFFTDEVNLDCSQLGNKEFDFKGFQYFPNPVNDVIVLKARNKIKSVSVYSVLGEEILKISPNGFETKLNMNSMQIGTYFIKVIINNSVDNFRIIKR